jgi:hypothetical protein
MRNSSHNKEIVNNYEARNYNILIGIDPGQHNGMFLYNKKRAEYYCKTVSFWELIRELSERKKDNILVYIENPNLNKPYFNREVGFRASTKIAQNVGSNKRDSQLIIEYMQINEIPYIEIRPTTSKWTDNEFKQITGIRERLSQHVRDAAKLIWRFCKTEY